MLKLRSIGIRDYRVLEGEQRIGRIRFAGERMPRHLALERRRPSDRWTSDGLGQRPRHGQGRLQGSLGRLEGQNLAGGAGGSLQGDEHSGRDDDKSPDDK